MTTPANAETWSAFKLDVESASELMQSCLLQLESAGGYDAELLNQLYRALHTFKGITRMMNLPRIERVAHNAEDLVGTARDRQQPIAQAGIDTLLKVLDFVHDTSMRAAESGQDAPEDQAQPVLNALRDCMETGLPDPEPAVMQSHQQPTDEVVLFDQGDIVLFQDQEPTMEGIAQATGAATASPTSATSPHPQPAATGHGRKPAGPRVRDDEYVRIQASKVKQLLDLASEIGLSAHAVTHHPAVEGLDVDSVADASHHLTTLVRELRDTAATLALVPIATLFGRMRRAVRDLVRETGKDIQLRLEGEDTEVDKALVDRLADPLLHLLRNAADHGIEAPDERKQRGKPAEATILVSASQHGGEVIVSITDDGRGLNRDKILARAVERGLLASPVTQGLEDSSVWDLIFHPGFSTAASVSSLSGRGVGLDVVRTTVESLHGSIAVHTASGLGTRISLHLPLTLAFLDALVLRSGACAFAIPLDVVSRIYRSTGNEVHAAGAGNPVIQVDQELAPVCWLDRFYGYATSKHHTFEDRVVVLVQTRRGKLALPIDELLGSQQVTMKPLYGPFRDIRAATACGLLGSGDVAIALDCERLHEHLH